MSQSKRICTTIGIFFIFSIFIFSKPEIVRADSSPPPGAIGSDLYPNANATKVRMEAETVLITIPEKSDYWTGHSIVTATFYMRNLGNETEEMHVRFPMNNNEYDFKYEAGTGNEFCGESEFPSIQNFSVLIDGEETNFSTSTKTFQNWWSSPDNPTYTTFNCWAHFNVVFPPDEQVIIQVQYKVGGFKWDPRLVSYKYILQTGKGWNGTIGTADIVIKLPYEISEELIDYAGPANRILDGQMIMWHFEDFEPEENIEIQMIDPSIWSRVVRETANVEKNSEDGEAWGRLGKAYKEAITERHGFLLISDYPEYYVNSIEAYQKATELLPNDIDWHWGYSEILCKAAMNNYGILKNEKYSYERACVNELITIYKLDPEYEDLLYFLDIWKRHETEFYMKYKLDNLTELSIQPSVTINATKIFEYIPTATETSLYTPTKKSTSTPINTPGPFLTHTPWPTNTLKIINTPTFTGTPTITITATSDGYASWRSDFPLDNNTSKKYQLRFTAISNLLVLVLVFLFYNLKKLD